MEKAKKDLALNAVDSAHYLEKAKDDVALAIIVACVILVILAVFTMLFFLVFVRKRRILNRKKEELSRSFERQLLQTQLEIQDQTLNNISQEIHDNFGQVLSFIKLSLNTSKSLSEFEKNEKIEESIQLISGLIIDMRDLSKSLSFERIKTEGLVKVISDEVNRLGRNGIIETELALTGTPIPIDHQTSLILYRIFQEGLNNTLKHSGSSLFKVELSYQINEFMMRLTDFGKGFDGAALPNEVGLGLSNMKKRAMLIGGAINIISQPGMGCSTTLILPFNP